MIYNKRRPELYTIYFKRQLQYQLGKFVKLGFKSEQFIKLHNIAQVLKPGQIGQI